MSAGTGELTLFGGFDDRIVVVEGDGRTEEIATRGRTLLYPWDEDSFVVVEDALGRPSKTTVARRRFSELRSMSGEANSVPWGGDHRLIPGLYPTVFAVGPNGVSDGEQATDGGADSRCEFIAGVFAGAVPVMCDGSWQAMDGIHLVGVAVGRIERVFVATKAGLTYAGRDRVEQVFQAGSLSWRPAAIEHDPGQARVLVASWNRWGSLGGPSTDVYVFDDATGRLVGQGHVDGLIERMALASGLIHVVDVEEGVRSVQLVPATV